MKLLETEESIIEQKGLFSNINSRSDVAMEIIASKPNFYEKWGILIFVIIFFVLLGLSYFFKYPDTVEGVAYLSSENAPKTILANQSGRLIKVFAKHNNEVNKSDIIGWIESPERGNHSEILLLYKQLKSVIQQPNYDGQGDRAFSKNFVNLGEIQNEYQILIMNLNVFDEYKKGFYSQKRAKLIDDISALNKISRNIEIQEENIIENNVLAKESFEANEKLFKKGVISADEYRAQKSKLLNNQLQLPIINSDVIVNLREQRDKATDVESIDYTEKQQERLVEQSMFSLKSKIEDWIDKYCIFSPIRGKLYFDRQIQEYQLLKAGEGIGYIIPKDITLYAEIILPQHNIGKVDTSMQVQLRFDAYPYQEFGAVVGKLINLSEIANEKGFTGIVELKNGLKTNQDIAIKYREGLQARAVIITKDMSMLKRFWYGILKKIDLNNK